MEYKSQEPSPACGPTELPAWTGGQEGRSGRSARRQVERGQARRAH